MRIKGMQDELKRDREELARLNNALGSTLDAVTALLVNIINLRVPERRGTLRSGGGIRPVDGRAAGTFPRNAPHARSGGKAARDRESDHDG